MAWWQRGCGGQQPMRGHVWKIHESDLFLLHYAITYQLVLFSILTKSHEILILSCSITNDLMKYLLANSIQAHGCSLAKL